MYSRRWCKVTWYSWDVILLESTKSSLCQTSTQPTIWKRTSRLGKRLVLFVLCEGGSSSFTSIQKGNSWAGFFWILKCCCIFLFQCCLMLTFETTRWKTPSKTNWQGNNNKQQQKRDKRTRHIFDINLLHCLFLWVVFFLWRHKFQRDKRIKICGEKTTKLARGGINRRQKKNVLPTEKRWQKCRHHTHTRFSCFVSSLLIAPSSSSFVVLFSLCVFFFCLFFP